MAATVEHYCDLCGKRAAVPVVQKDDFTIEGVYFTRSPEGTITHCGDCMRAAVDQIQKQRALLELANGEEPTMSEVQKTAIQWADYTWNPWQGCTHVSPGCENCYMFEEKKRYGQKPEIVVRSKDNTFQKPLKRNRQKEYKIESGARVFTCSWSDWFHPLADKWRQEAWEIIKQRPDVLFIILTKRTHRMADCLPGDWGDGYPNVVLGVSVENQAMLPRVEKLLRTPAAIRAVSYEPALEMVDFSGHMPGQRIDHAQSEIDARRGIKRIAAPTYWEHHGIDWLIIGGESGNGARAFDIEWARKNVIQCREAGVACFVKQLGAVPMDGHTYLKLESEKGGDWNEWPDDLKVREFPAWTPGELPQEEK